MAEDSDSKTEEPTSRRLEEARRKGDVAKSADFAQAAALAGAFSALTLLGGWMAQNLAVSLIPFIEHPEAIALEGGGAVKVARYAMLCAAPISRGSASRTENTPRIFAAGPTMGRCRKPRSIMISTASDTSVSGVTQ